MLVTCTGCRGRAVGLQLDEDGLCGHCHRVRHGTAQAAQRKQLLSTSRKRGTGSSSRAAQKPDDSDSDADSEADEPAAKPIAKPTAAKPSRRSCVDDPFPVCDPARGVRLAAARSSLLDAGDAGAFSSLPAELLFSVLSCRVLSAHDLSRLRRSCLCLYAATWQRELIPEITEALLLRRPSLRATAMTHGPQPITVLAFVQEFPMCATCGAWSRSLPLTRFCCRHCSDQGRVADLRLIPA